MDTRTSLPTLAPIVALALAPALGCPLPAASTSEPALGPPALTLRSVASGTSVRWYHLSVPTGLDPARPAPLLVALHGGGGNALQFEGSNGLAAAADARGFLLALPEGVSGLARQPPFLLETWNAGNCCGAAASRGVDDVAFLADLIDDVAATHAVDPRRVYLTGMSNGGMMAYRAAVEMPERIAAIAPVGAALGVAGAPASPVPVIAFHGLLDTNVPLQGGPGSGISGTTFRSQIASLTPFLTVNGCTLPSTPAEQIGQAIRYEAPAPTTGADVHYWLLLDGGHSWPGRDGSPKWRPSEPVNRDISANDELFDFFDSHPRVRFR